MKREDVKGIFAEATAEQIDKILDLNSSDIGKAKKGYDENIPHTAAAPCEGKFIGNTRTPPRKDLRYRPL